MTAPARPRFYQPANAAPAAAAPGRVLDYPPGTGPSTGLVQGMPDGSEVVAPFRAFNSPADDADTVNDSMTRGGRVRLGPWRYSFKSAVYMTSGQELICTPRTVIDFSGSGDCIRAYDSSSYNSRTQVGGGVYGFPQIQGYNAAAGSAGIHAGDIFQWYCDAQAVGFNGAGSVGFHFDNQYYWMEQLQARIFAESCSTGVVFDCSGQSTSTGSYARAVVDVFLSQGAGAYNGVLVQNGAKVYNGRLGIYGNFTGSASPLSNYVLQVTGSAPAGHPASDSSIVSGILNIGVEIPAGYAYAPTTVIFGNNPNNLLQLCKGVIDFSSGGGAFASCTTNLGNFNNYQGIVRGDSALPAWQAYGSAPAQSISANGATIPAGYGSVVPVNPGAASYTGLVLSAGSFDGQVVHVVNMGSGSLTFAAAATSNVAAGTAAVISGLVSRGFVWDAAGQLWY